MNQVRVVYIAYEGFLDWPVFDTQVVEPLKEIGKSNDLSLTLVAFERLDKFFLNIIRVIQKRLLVKSQIESRIIFLPRLIGSIGIAINQFIVAMLFIGSRRPLVFHCRGIKGVLTIRLLKRLRPSTRIIFDVRGAEPEEIFYVNHSKNVLLKRPRFGNTERKFQWSSKLEKNAVETADFYSCVSETMKTHMQKKYGITEERIDIVPCGVSRNFFFDPNMRAKTREILGLEKKLVFVYVGSMNAWQLPHLLLKLFKRIQSNISEAFLIILTHDLQAAVSLLRLEAIPDCSVLVKKVPNQQIPQMLCAADFGLLLREKSKLNLVSSPIKFGEYVCCGLPVIMTDAVTDARLLLERMGVGVILPSKVAIDQIDYSKLCNDILMAKLNEEERINLSRAMLEKYGWPNLAKKYTQYYLELAGLRNKEQ